MTIFPLQVPTSRPTDIAENLVEIRQRIANAAQRANRRPEDVTLVAVSKLQPADAVVEALQAGQICFGENRVQEAGAKFGAVRPNYPTLRLHLIGGLQTNKAREAVRIADVVESLDRPRLADALANAIAEEGRCPRLLVQVNVGDEAQKSGISRTDADSFIDLCQERFGTALVGLMCVPPATDNPEPHFQWLAECARIHGLGQLSMGMSGDFETAIACGATHVRVGTAIFGSRA